MVAAGLEAGRVETYGWKVTTVTTWRYDDNEEDDGGDPEEENRKTWLVVCSDRETTKVRDE